MSHRTLASVLVVVAIMGVAGCSSRRARWAGPQPSVRPVRWAQVAGPARATMESLTAGGTIRRLALTQGTGRTFYAVEATVRGRDVAYDIGVDGTVLASGLRVPFAALPLTVRAAAEIYFDFATGPSALVKVQDGRKVYEVQGRKGRTPVTLKLSETGEIVEARQ